jgi:ATP phosphoribosyltransferase regulatory subunit
MSASTIACGRSAPRSSASVSEIGAFAVPGGPITVPAGAKDVLPIEAAELRAIEGAWLACVSRWGYREVMTPVLEFADVIDRAQAGASADAYRLFDEAGRVLVLRPDITIPVARLIATRMADHPGPVRVSYMAAAFHPPRSGRPRPGEVRQAGIELVGAGGSASDAEALALLVHSLRAAGVARPRVGLADVSLTRAVMDAVGVGEAERVAMGDALAARDLVSWRRLVGASLPSGAGADLLADLPSMRGGLEVLERIRDALPAAAPACDSLRVTIEMAGRHGVGDELAVDLGVLRDWSYYSGVVFEAFGRGATEPLAVGGRYDGLAARFGSPRPAVGFAVALQQLHRAVLDGSPPATPLQEGVVLAGGLDTHAGLAATARDRGVVVIALTADDADRADALAEADNWRYVARPEHGGTVSVFDRASGERRVSRSLAEALEPTR